MVHCREAARLRKAEEARQRRVHRAELLRDQLTAMSAQQARKQAATAWRIRSAGPSFNCLFMKLLCVRCQELLSNTLQEGRKC